MPRQLDVNVIDDFQVHTRYMDETGQQRLWFALRWLANTNKALEDIRGTNPEVEGELRGMRDRARWEVESSLPPDAQAELAVRRAELRKKYSQLDEESFEFADTALVIGISTAAAILIAPVGAWIVAESIIKELVKAAVGGLFVGVATAAAELFVARRRGEPLPQPDQADAVAAATLDVGRSYSMPDTINAGEKRSSTPVSALGPVVPVEPPQSTVLRDLISGTVHKEEPGDGQIAKGPSLY